MLIIHGTRTDEKFLGMVADNCLLCGKLSLLSMVQYRERQHIYFIPFGAGKLVSTVLKCEGCGGASTCQPGAYADWLPQKLAKSLDFSEVLERTNPKLAEANAYRADLEKRVRESVPVGPRGIDARVELAFVKMASLDANNPRVNVTQAKLAQWSFLDGAAQSNLLREVDELVEQHRRQQSAIGFLNFIIQRFKPDKDGGAPFLIFMFVVFLGIGFSVKSTTGANTGVIFGSLMAALGLSFWIERRMLRRRHKRFFRKRFLVELAKRNLSISEVMEPLLKINTSDKAIDARMRGMVKALPLLTEVLAEDNRYLDHAEKRTHWSDMEDALRHANPKAGQSVACRHEPYLPAFDASRTRPVAIDARVESTFEKLATLNPGDRRVIEAKATLAQWRALDASAQSKLLQDVDKMVDERQRHESSVNFLNFVVTRFKPEIDAGPGFFTLIVVFVAGVTFSASCLEKTTAAIGVMVSLAAAIALAWWVQRRLLRRAHKRFFRKVFLAELEKRRLALPDVMKPLRKVNTTDESVDARVRGMIKALPRLTEVLAEENRYLEQSDVHSDSEMRLSPV
jgi:hypothetical protein